jgi:phospholipase/carboxylesterase
MLISPGGRRLQPSRIIDRRGVRATACLAFAAVAVHACTVATDFSPGNDGRLTARPASASTSTRGATDKLATDQPISGSLGAEFAPGTTSPLKLERSRDAVLQLPAKATHQPLALLVMLHGAGGSGEGVLRRVAAAAEDAGVAVLAPDSRDATWDGIRGGFGPDVAFIDRALARVFERVPIDPERVAVGGFSDGATYALSLGLVNGDLFRRVVAFSPGFIVGGTPQGKPRFFVSHGKADQILPIDQCSRVIVPQLQRRGYEVTFKEFDGGHQVPSDIALEALRWLGTGR